MTTAKKIFLTILIIAALACAAYYLYSKNVIAPTTSLQTPEEQPKKISITDKKITDNTKPFEIDITYPYIEGQDGFNNFVENIINSEVDSFKQISLENDAAVKEIDPESYAQFPRSYSLAISYDKGRLDDNMISAVINIYNFTGGAHGAAYFKAVNWDFRTNKEVKLADIFSETPDYLQKISDYCIQNLKKQMTQSGAIEMTDDSWIQEGAGPKEENFSIFLLSDANIDNPTITFYFTQYQVAAYAAGDFKVTMPTP
jgi:hypothetical protein